MQYDSLKYFLKIFIINGKAKINKKKKKND